MSDTGRIKLQDVSGKWIELMKWTCGKCGYTIVFDLNVPRTVPHDNDQKSKSCLIFSGEALVPELRKQLLSTLQPQRGRRSRAERTVL
jgi:hypothetical protein